MIAEVNIRTQLMHNSDLIKMVSLKIMHSSTQIDFFWKMMRHGQTGNNTTKFCIPSPSKRIAGHYLH